MNSSKAARQITIVSTIASALAGAAMFLSISFFWPRAVLEFMRVRAPQMDGPLPDNAALIIAAMFITVTLLLAIAVLIARWLLLRLGLSRPLIVLAIVMTSAFALGFAGETASQVIRAWGNLTASDSTGWIFEDGRLTAHGWETIARRAVAVSIYAGIMVAAFAAARAAIRNWNFEGSM